MRKQLVEVTAHRKRTNLANKFGDTFGELDQVSDVYCGSRKDMKWMRCCCHPPVLCTCIATNALTVGPSALIDSEGCENSLLENVTTSQEDWEVG